MKGRRQSLILIVGLLVVLGVFTAHTYSVQLDKAAPDELDVIGDVLAEGFVDRDNTAYYADPAGTSFLNNLDLAGNLTVSGLTMGKIYMTSSGTIASTDGGTRELYWDKANGDIEIANTSGDWMDYWWQAQKAGTTSGMSNAQNTGTANAPIISAIDTNTYGFEVHFGQADGEEG